MTLSYLNLLYTHNTHHHVDHYHRDGYNDYHHGAHPMHTIPNTHHEHEVDDHVTGEEGVNQNWKLMLKIVLLSYCHTLVEKCPPNDPLIEQPDWCPPNTFGSGAFDCTKWS